MRVLNINSYYYSSTVHKELKSSLEGNRVELKTYIPLEKGYKPRFECGNINKEEKGIIYSECYNKIDRYIYYIKHNKILKDLEQKCNIKDIDCIHAHSLFSNGYIAYKLNEKYNKPYIVAVRSTDINVFFKKMIHMRRLGIDILKNAKKIIFLSRTSRDECIYKFIPNHLQLSIMNKAIILPNGIDDYWHSNKKISSIKNTKNIKLIFVGDICKRKNILKVVEASNILIKKGFDIELTIVGSIIDNKIMKKLRNVKYLKYKGRVSKEELIKIYRDNDIFVMPSKHETFGLVYAEAMSQGLPIIYTRGQGFDGHFGEGVIGYSVGSENQNEIAERIIDILKNYEVITKNSIRGISKFRWEKIALEYIKIYESIFKI